MARNQLSRPSSIRTLQMDYLILVLMILWSCSCSVLGLVQAQLQDKPFINHAAADGTRKHSKAHDEMRSRTLIRGDHGIEGGRRSGGADVKEVGGAGPPAVAYNFSAYFVFGDSLVDVGNNNYIVTLARANTRPYGIDFLGGQPTGRYCNGKIVPDFVAEILSLPFPPPYLAPTTRGPTLLTGVSYASSAAGILRSSGYPFIGRVDMDTQIRWFANNIQEIQQLLGMSKAQDLIARSFISITIGGNDYVNNYLLRISPTSQYTVHEFQEILLNKFSSQLQELYKLGARNIAVSSIGPIGCIPSQLSRKSKNGECLEFENNLALRFNEGLKSLLGQLNAQLPGANYVYAESFTPIFQYRSNPQQYGFKFGVEACCGAGRFKGLIPCLPIFTPCPDREDYVFWDPFHPTETTNRKLASLFYQTLSNS